MQTLKKNLPVNKTQKRNFVLNREGVDQEKRTVELSFSSEEPVKRWFGKEILDHNPKSIRLDRLESGANLLIDHNWNDVIGVVESVRIDPEEKKARAVVRFGKSVRAEEIFQDVLDGIRKNVSVGYIVHNFNEESEDDDKLETYRAVDWEPMEISLVSVPADITVGVDRSEDSTANEGDNPPIEKERKQKMQEKTAVQDNKAQISKKERDQIRLEVIREEKEDYQKSEKERIKNLMAVGREYGVERLALKFVETGDGVQELKEAILKDIKEGRSITVENPDNVDLEKKDVEKYSFIKAINYLGNKNRKPEEGGLELEVSREIEKQRGKDTEGLFIPSKILKQRVQTTGPLARDLTVGTATAGGNTVQTDLLAGSFIEMLHNRMVVRDLGAMVLTGLDGNIAIPRETGDVTAYWVAEGGSVTKSDSVFDQVTMSPKTVGAWSNISRQLLLQSSIDIEGFVRLVLARRLALAIDLAAINGTGTSNQPTGILNATGVGSVALGTDGAAPTWGSMIDLETEVAIDNADLGALRYLSNARVRGKLKKTPKVTNQPIYLMDDEGRINGYPSAWSNQVPNSFQKGASAADLSAMIFGNWNDLIIGEWGGFELIVDPYSLAESGTKRVTVHQSMDIALRHPDSFAVIADMVTT